MEGNIERKAGKKGGHKLRGWLIALGVTAAIFLAGYLCCTYLS